MKRVRLIGELEFKAMYMLAIENGLAAVGKHLSRVTVDFISRKYGVSPNDTYRKPALLSESLNKTLGSMGGVLVETRIIASLYSQLGLTSPPEIILRPGHPEDFGKYILEILEMVSTD